MESDLSQDEKTIIPAMPAQKAIIEEFFIMFLHPFFVEICSAQPELMGVRYFTAPGIPQSNPYGAGKTPDRPSLNNHLMIKIGKMLRGVQGE